MATWPGRDDEESFSSQSSESRSITEEDFLLYCRHTMSCIASGKRGTDCCMALRNLYRFLAGRKKRRSILDELLKQLKSIIFETGKCPKKLRLLAMSILRDLSPTVGYNIKMSSMSADVNWLPLVFPLILAQGKELGHIAQHVSQFVRWIKSSPGSSYILQRNSLLCIYIIQSYYGLHLLSEDHVKIVNRQMVHWLGNASVVSAANPHQRKIFSGSKSKFQPVTELDDSACHLFFTVLNLAQYCFPDQFLNIYTFSVLRRWIFDTWSSPEGQRQISLEIPQDRSPEGSECSVIVGPSLSDASSLEDRLLHTPGAEEMYQEISHKFTSSSPSDSPSFSEVTQAFGSSEDRVGTPVRDGNRKEEDSVSIGGASNLSSMRQVFGSESSIFSEGGQDDNLARKTMAYCYRLLRQCECKPCTSQDAALRKACIVEAVSLLDFFCAQEKALVAKAIQAVRRVYNIVRKWPASWTDVLLPMMLFFVNHGEAVILEPEPYIKFYFGDVLTRNFSSYRCTDDVTTCPEIAFETVNFCLENTEKLRQSTTVFTDFFPNLFKILAWYPRTFMREFLELLPAMISEKTFVEVFHFILDLPCLSAALQTVKRAEKQGNVYTESVVSVRKSVSAYHDPKYKPIFAFILRQEGGLTDTIDKLDVLHSLFQDCTKDPLMLVCSQVSWLLLRIYFKTIVENDDASVAKELFPAILERATSVVKIESYVLNIQSLLGEQILVLFELHPFLVVEYAQEIIEFIHEMKTLDSGSENLFTNLVWVIGEYASSRYDERCGNQAIIEFHEAVESVTYELTLSMNANNLQNMCSPRLVSVLMSTLAKLASRCQDLIPKVILCISKVSRLRSEFVLDLAEKDALLVRANELIGLLKVPNIAPLALSPDSSLETGRLHRDRHTSLSFFLETAKEMMFSK